LPVLEPIAEICNIASKIIGLFGLLVILQNLRKQYPIVNVLEIVSADDVANLLDIGAILEQSTQNNFFA